MHDDFQFGWNGNASANHGLLLGGIIIIFNGIISCYA